MAREPAVTDYITPIKEILTNKCIDRKRTLHRFIYRSRKIHNRHLGKLHSVDQTVKKLLDPQWLPKVRRFNPDEWRKTADDIWKRAIKLLDPVARPEIILFPGFNTFNGRVYKIDNKPVIGGSPDFPHSTGTNLRVLLAHEYAHFARWRKTGIPYENVPIYASIYEEGWATWFSTKLLPDCSLSRLFMSNLHKTINMPDPEGGYLAWCRKNLNTINAGSQKVLKSKGSKDLGRFFHCKRLRGDKTPIRTGYYLGYCLMEMLSETMPPRQLINIKPTYKRMSVWLDHMTRIVR